MRRILLALLLVSLFPLSAFAAPFLAWDAVTTGTDGLQLGAGLEVTAYKVYRCAPGPACTKLNGTLAGTIIAPVVQFDLAGTPTPSVYVVTAVNKVGESADSLAFKVVPPDFPKNLRLP